MLIAIAFGPSNTFSKSIPDIIKAAAQSLLGIFALMIIALSLIAYYFFQRSTAKTKSRIFYLLLLGVASFGVAVVNSNGSNQSEHIRATLGRSLGGTVRDELTQKAVHNAKVIFSQSGYKSTDYTDSLGAFHFAVPTAQSDGLSRLEFIAQGYEPFDLEVSDQSTQEFQIGLTPSKGPNIPRPKSVGISHPSPPPQSTIISSTSKDDSWDSDEPPVEFLSNGKLILRRSSGIKSLNRSNNLEVWHQVCVGPAPTGYTLVDARYLVKGKEECGQSIECEWSTRNDSNACFKFRLRQTSDISSLVSEGQIIATYQARNYDNPILTAATIAFSTTENAKSAETDLMVRVFNSHGDVTSSLAGDFGRFETGSKLVPLNLTVAGVYQKREFIGGKCEIRIQAHNADKWSFGFDLKLVFSDSTVLKCSKPESLLDVNHPELAIDIQ